MVDTRLEQIRDLARKVNIAAIIPFLSDESQTVQREAVKALSALRATEAIPTLVNAMSGAPTSLKLAIAGALINMRDPGLQALIDQIPHEPLEVRYQLLRDLGILQLRHTLSLLITLLQDENPQVRELAAVRLSQADNNQAVLPLIVALKDEFAGVRLAAVGALGRLRDPIAVGPLIRLLDDPSPRVRQNTAMVLGIIGDQRALQPLVAQLLGDDAAMRKYAALAIGGMGHDAIDPLLGVLKHKDSEVRALAVTLLGEIADPAAVPGLIRALDDEAQPRRRPISEIAAEALEKVGTPEALEAVAKWRAAQPPQD